VLLAWAAAAALAVALRSWDLPAPHNNVDAWNYSFFVSNYLDSLHTGSLALMPDNGKPLHYLLLVAIQGIFGPSTLHEILVSSVFLGMVNVVLCGFLAHQAWAGLSDSAPTGQVNTLEGRATATAVAALLAAALPVIVYSSHTRLAHDWSAFWFLLALIAMLRAWQGGQVPHGWAAAICASFLSLSIFSHPSSALLLAVPSAMFAFRSWRTQSLDEVLAFAGMGAVMLALMELLFQSRLVFHSESYLRSMIEHAAVANTGQHDWMAILTTFVWPKTTDRIFRIVMNGVLYASLAVLPAYALARREAHLFWLWAAACLPFLFWCLNPDKVVYVRILQPIWYALVICLGLSSGLAVLGVGYLAERMRPGRSHLAAGTLGLVLTAGLSWLAATNASLLRTEYTKLADVVRDYQSSVTHCVAVLPQGKFDRFYLHMLEKDFGIFPVIVREPSLAAQAIQPGTATLVFSFGAQLDESLTTQLKLVHLAWFRHEHAWLYATMLPGMTPPKEPQAIETLHGWSFALPENYVRPLSR
jgi:hypothetical protein